MAQLTTNVEGPERIIAATGGAWLLFDIVSNRKVNFLQTLTGAYLLLRGITGYCLIYDRLGKVSAHQRPENINIRTSLSVNRPRNQVYAFWRRLENLPEFMQHIKSVEVIDEKTSRWTAAPEKGIGKLTWKSEIVKDDPGSILSWRSLPGSAVDHAGKVTFQDDGETATLVTIVISYQAPMGIVGEKAARLLTPVFRRMIHDDIRNFKMYMETGALIRQS